MTFDEIKNRFTYHTLSPEGVQRHADLSAAFVEVATRADAICLDGREKSLVFNHLEQAKFWASAAVARNPETR